MLESMAAHRRGKDFNTKPQETQCRSCTLGQEYKAKNMECSPCDLGRFGTSTFTCEPCPLNTFQDTKGSTSCNSAQDCIIPGTIPNEKQTGCSKPPWKVPTDCKTGEQFLNDTVEDHKQWSCQTCPDGADCSGNVRWQQVVPKQNYRQMSYDNETFAPCLKINACSSSSINSNNNVTSSCTLGHSGELCSQCLPKFASATRTDTCEKCPESSDVGYAFALTIVISIGLFSFLVYDNLDGARQMIPTPQGGEDDNRTATTTTTTSTSSTNMPFHTIVLRIVSSYFQISGMLLQFNLTLPPSVRLLTEIESGASSLGERLIRFECLTDERDDYQMFMARELSMVWLIPCISICLCAVFWFILFRRKWSTDGFVSSLMILFYTFFPSVVVRLALTFSCQTYGSRSLLSEALSVQCWSAQHWEAFMYVGLPGLLLYVVIIPTGLARKIGRAHV
jgi:hypothetical protein